MKCLKIITPILSTLILCSSLYAQYDTGTVIFTHNDSDDDLISIQKNYIIEDIDGDFNADVIMVKRDEANNSNYLTWYKGDGSGNFTPQADIDTVSYNFREKEIFYEDMNEDGIKDIVYQNSNTSFKVLLNNGQGSISTQIVNEVIIADLDRANLKEVADIDGDGDMDVLFSGKHNRRENCLLGYNDGSGNFSNYSYLNNDDTKIVTMIETGDIDGDGDLDIIYSGAENLENTHGMYYTGAYIRVYENVGMNSFIFKGDLLHMPVINYTVSYGEIAFSHIKVQDINSDGNEELLIEYAIWDECEYFAHSIDCLYLYQFHILDYNTQNDEFVILEEYNSWLHGYTLSEYGNSPYFYKIAFHIQFGNQNNDNSLDILSVNVPQGRLQWYLGDGNGNFNNTQTVNFNSQYSGTRPALRVVDLDNDNDLDIFVLLNDYPSSTLTVYKNLASTSSCAPFIDLGSTSLIDGTYQAGTTIISRGNIVVDNNNVVLKAGNNVKLESGFKVPANSTLKVRVSACN